MTDGSAKRSSGLEGARVAILEARMTGELATLVRSHGGEVLAVPAVLEVPREAGEDIQRLLDALAVREPGEPAPLFIFSTGVGLSAFFREVTALGRRAELEALLVDAVTVCRGPKPVAALKKEGFEASVRVKEPFTTQELVEALAPIELEGRRVVLLHYGEANEALVELLKAREARLVELLLYAWRLPEDLGPLAALVESIIRREVTAVVFTSQVQARHLFEVARRGGREDALREALTTHTIVASVGPTCGAKLAELGVPAKIQPERPKMGPMVTELARFVAARG